MEAFLPLLLTALTTGILAPPFGAAQSKPKQPATYTIPTPPKPDFAPLDWLTGEWSGEFAGKNPPRGKVGLTVGYDLDNEYLVLRENVTFAATKTAPATSELWMGILSARHPEAGYLMRMYSNTGFMTRYSVSVEANGSVVRFVPDGGDFVPRGWLFRLALTRAGENLLDEKVEVAPPGKDFFVYYTARLTKNPSPPAATVKPSAPVVASAPSGPNQENDSSSEPPADSNPQTTPPSGPEPKKR